MVVLGEADLLGEQQSELDAILSEFPDVLITKVGTASNCNHFIDTGIHTPTQTHPYRVAPGWLAEFPDVLFTKRAMASNCTHFIETGPHTPA